MRIAPPTRGSNSQTGLVKPFGPHHCASCAASVQARNTNARGASNKRVMVTSRSSSGFLAAAAVMRYPLDWPMLLLSCRLLIRPLAIDHPRRAELIGQHAEALRPESFLDRHPHRAALRQRRKDAVGVGR